MPVPRLMRSRISEFVGGLCPLDSCIGFDIDSDLERQIRLAESIDRAVFKKVACQNNPAFVVLPQLFPPASFYNDVYDNCISSVVFCRQSAKAPDELCLNTYLNIQKQGGHMPPCKSDVLFIIALFKLRDLCGMSLLRCLPRCPCALFRR